MNEQDELERLRAENERLREANKRMRFTAIIKPVRPIGAAIGYELPKKGTTNLVVIDFRERVRQARLKAPLVEPKTIEHQSDPVA